MKVGKGFTGFLKKSDIQYSKDRQFTDYAPMVFRHIRTEIMRISNDEYKTCGEDDKEARGPKSKDDIITMCWIAFLEDLWIK